MIHPRVIFAIAAMLPACSPAPETDVQTILPTSAEWSWEDRFRLEHGTPYDPLSRLDREKMAALRGESVVAESATTDEAADIRESPIPPTVKQSLTVREAILDVARPLIGQTETHGSNRSPLIDSMNRLTGVPLGSPYCASFNAWCYSEADAPAGWPKSAWSPDWVKSPTWTSAKGGKTPQPADAFGIWFSNKNRVAHTGIVETWGTSSAVTIEGNTSPSVEFGSSSDRDGDGIWRKRRLRKQIYAVRNWIGG